MIRRGLGLLVAVLVAAFAAGVVHAAVGDHVPDADFDLTAGQDHVSGIAWDGAYLRVLDPSDDVVYAYTPAGIPRIDKNFNASTPGTDHFTGITSDGENLYLVDYDLDSADPEHVYVFDTDGDYLSRFSVDGTVRQPLGVTWDGDLLRIVDGLDHDIKAYTSAGVRSADKDFDLDSDNADPQGITWDGKFFRVLDEGDDKVYAYTLQGVYSPDDDYDLAADNDDAYGITTGPDYLRVLDRTDDQVYSYEKPYDSSPLSYTSILSGSVVAYSAWKCLRSESGQTTQINNASLTIHGICATTGGTTGVKIEIHMASTTSYAQIDRFARSTGYWRFAEGITATSSERIFDDRPTRESSELDSISEGSLAVSERRANPETSNRLGFATATITIDDADCEEESDMKQNDVNALDGRGYACSTANLGNLSSGETATFWYALAEHNDIVFADRPGTPDSVLVSRNEAYTEATITWTLYDAVAEYEIQRVTAVVVDVADATRIEYGNPITHMITGTQAGLNEYTDSTIVANRTYQYRVRARGADADSWSAWSEYVFSGAIPKPDVPAPSNLELTRDSSSVIASWTTPAGDLDNYVLQRQELIVVEGSTFFGNVTTLGGDPWIPATTTMYRDQSILPDQTYEYRVAAVNDDRVGTYTDWFRVGPINVSLGSAPSNFGPLETGRRVFDERYEFWLGWDSVGRADDYEVESVFHHVVGGQSRFTHFVTDPAYFLTTYGRVSTRVRGRKIDAGDCAAAPNSTCFSEWTAWHDVGFTPIVTVEDPPMVDDSSDDRTMELRKGMEEIIEVGIKPLGTTPDPGRVLEFLVLVVGLGLAGASIARTWRGGMASLGVGMGAAVLVLVLFAGYRLFGTNLAWAIGAQALVAASGLYALVHQLGVLR